MAAVSMNSPGQAMPNTPGFVGYLVAIVVSWLVLVAIVVVLAACSADQWSDLSVLPFFLIGVVILGTPIGAVGALLVHLFCHQASRQAVHVWAAGGAGVVVPVLAMFLVEPQSFFGAWIAILVSLPIALSAMIGRAAVIPLVTARRAQLASVRPLRVP